MSVMVKNKTNKNYKRSQRGRSMVEMLGVLSIIGVLSVGGVYGYGVAMKKHKANELLHQASMLATTVSAQIDSLGGDLPETITDFGSTNYGKFSTSVTQTEDKKKFVLTIENVDSAVCTQMEKMTGGMVQGASCSGTTLTLSYYKNLATTEAEGEKSPTGGSSSSSFNPDGLIKGDGSTCSEALGECQVCIEGEVVDSNALCKGNQFCFSGTCQTV